MDKVLLIYPRSQERDGAFLPPLSLIYLATFLADRYDVRIVDQRNDEAWQESLTRELSKGRCVCAGISTMTGPQIGAALEVAALIRSQLPSLPIVWGGVHPSLCPEQTIQHPLVDMVVVGDGEEAFPELVDTLCAHGNLQAVRGILFKENDRINRTAPRPPFALQNMPEPVFGICDLNRYRLPEVVTTGKCLPIVTSRGCPFHCGFCYNAQFHQRRWSALSALQTVDLIGRLQARYGITDLYLLDDNFFVDLKRVEVICCLLEERGISLRIHNANCRADTVLKMENWLLAQLKKAGFSRLFVGVESGSDRILKHIHKDVTVSQVLTANLRLKEADVSPCYSFMAGFPGETVADLKMTLALMRQLLEQNPAAIIYGIQFYTPFPGTDLHQEAQGMGLAFPQNLEGWIDFHYDRLRFPAADAAHGQFLRDIHSYSRYLDEKQAAAHHSWKRSMIRLYSRILRSRIKREWYRGMFEIRLLQWWRERQETPHIFHETDKHCTSGKAAN